VIEKDSVRKRPVLGVTLTPSPVVTHSINTPSEREVMCYTLAFKFGRMMDAARKNC